MATLAVRSALRSLWNEPRAAGPPPVSRWDWALVGVCSAAALVEAVFRPHLELRPVALVLGLVPIVALFWRRSHPLTAVLVAFGVHGVTYAFPLVGHDHEAATLYATAAVLVFPYSLLRWGSGREVVAGSAFILVTHLPMAITSSGGAGEGLAGLAVLELPAALGATMRYWSVSRSRSFEQVKLRERELLARELHDTVAHHVSAIAIQAQAGRTVASSDPGAAADVLAVIEREASRTLAEMRTMVSALRDGEEPALAPQRGAADIARLAEHHVGGPVIEVAPTGDLGDLEPSVDAAVYRLAQESITNAVRHARRATRIRVEVDGEPRCVRLRVTDDGDATAAGASASGFGLVGMHERVHLLGGTFEAGPDLDGGWTVTAVLPRSSGAP